MKTVARPDDNPPDPQAATPYFRRLAAYREAFDQAAAGRGLPPRSWAA